MDRRMPWYHHTWQSSSPLLLESVEKENKTKNPIQYVKNFCPWTNLKWKFWYEIVTLTRGEHKSLRQGHLKHGEQRLGEVVKGASPGLIKVELPPKELHAQQWEDDDEEEEQEQQGSDGANGVEKWSYKVGKRVPVSMGEKSNGKVAFIREANAP